MIEKRKHWQQTPALLATTVATTFAMGAAHALPVAPTSAPMVAMQASGEAEMVDASIDLRNNDVEYLAQLGLIRGHLWVGMKLYEQGHIKMAKTHMKHPGDELYAGLQAAFEARDLPGFADELSALADSVIDEDDDVIVMANYEALQQAIAKNEPIADMTAKNVLLSVASMLSTAAEEYAIGIKAGEVSNVHEYQDALGFTEIVLARLDALSPEQKRQAEDELGDAEILIRRLLPMWPTTTPSGTLEGDASEIYGVAAEIELTARSL